MRNIFEENINELQTYIQMLTHYSILSSTQYHIINVSYELGVSP